MERLRRRKEKKNIGETPGTRGFPYEADFVCPKRQSVERGKKYFALYAILHVCFQLANKIRLSMHLTVNCVCALRSH